mgnify:CR=1 FL=1
MSTHHKNRQPSGCTGCVASLLIVVYVMSAALYGCWQFATWLLFGH